MRVLVVEDHQDLAQVIARGLRRWSMAVDVACTGEAAWERLEVNDYDVLVLDRDLPGVSGDEICRRLADAGACSRILMLTAAGDLADRVAGLRMGADDYLAKPFEYDELVARVQALGRRVRPTLPPVLCKAGISLDTGRRTAARNGRTLTLAPKEFAVLHELLAADGAVVSAEELLERAWDEHTDPFTSAVRITMSKLRAKLGDPPVIVTVPGAGYRI
jgi:DNA-binding response OmpR family regulator